MHIILGLLGSIVTILVLLNRLSEAGIDLRALNPFLWQRRRKWRKLNNGNPLFTIESPMEVTAILMVAAAKSDGDVSIEEKQRLQELFQSEFNLTQKDAAALLVSSSFLLGDGTELRANIARFISRSKDNFTTAQCASAVKLVTEVSNIRSEQHPNAADIIVQMRKQLIVTTKDGSWAPSSS